MIQLANEKTGPLVRKMWERCFDDSPEFIELYFRRKYRGDNTLLCFEDGEAVASLQMLPYRFTCFGTEVDSAYISGACTLPEHRNRGHMGKLLCEAFRLMRQRDIALSILIPAEEWLYGYYARYGYVRVFQQGKTTIPLESIYKTYRQDEQGAYEVFDARYRKQDFCVQKSMEDFRAIMEDAVLEGFPPKTNLSGMARIIDAGRLLQCFAQKHAEKSFAFSLEDKILHDNSGTYTVTGGRCLKVSGTSAQPFLNEAGLCRFLFGSQPDKLPEELSRHSQAQHPIMNLMLE